MNKTNFVCSLLSLLLLSSFHAFATGAVNVDELNRILKEKNAGWVAKKSDISDKSIDELKLLLGAGEMDRTVQFVHPEGLRAQSLPSSLDWRNHLGGNWVPPATSQGSCGSCVAFAAVGTMETQYKIATGIPGYNIQLSPQYLFSCGGGRCNLGWFPAAAARFLRNQGVPDEACMPYLSGGGQDVACSASCADHASRRVRIAAYTTPTNRRVDIDRLKTALQYGPLLSRFVVYSDFFAYGSGVYRHSWGEQVGGHALSIVGYNDVGRYFIVRNSWGSGWGMDGFVNISYDDSSGLGAETWQYQMPSFNGSVAFESPSDETYFSNKTNLKVVSTYSGTESIVINLINLSGTVVKSVSCSGHICERALERQNLADGEYKLEGFARDASGQNLGQSPQRTVFLSQGQPKLALSLHLPGKILSGLANLTVRVSSQPVPMNGLEFHYKSGGIERIHKSDHADDGMTVRWFTKNVSNGIYEIWMTGRVMETSVETPHQFVTVAN